MASRVSDGFRFVMGIRQKNSDGFTYDYGKYSEYKSRRRNKATIERSRRNDKRSAKQKDMREALTE